MAKQRRKFLITYEALTIMLGLEPGSVLRVDNNAGCERIEIITDDERFAKQVLENAEIPCHMVEFIQLVVPDLRSAYTQQQEETPEKV
jgi:hypothetical protein